MDTVTYMLMMVITDKMGFQLFMIHMATKISTFDCSGDTLSLYILFAF